MTPSPVRAAAPTPVPNGRADGSGEAAGGGPADRELMERVKQGELELLSTLFERHQRRLFNFFLRLTPNRSAAEDLVQEVFVRMLKYRGSFRDGAEFSPWMFTLARNAAVDLYRARPELEVQADPEAPEPAAPLEHPVESLERREREAMLEAALGRLPHDRRELLMMARFGEMKYDAIAEALGVSVGAIKVRVHRAMKELRDAYRAVSGESFA